MLDFDIWCPTCGKAFKGEYWKPGNCPFCNMYYSWSEYTDKIQEDTCISIDWDWSENVK